MMFAQKRAKRIKTGEFIRVMTLMGKRLWIYGFAVIALCILETLMQLVIIYLSKDIINAAAGKDLNQIVKLLPYLGVMALMMCVFSPLLGFISNYCVEWTLGDIRLKAFKHIENLPLSYFDKSHSGDILSRLNNDVSVLSHIYHDGIHTILSAFMMGVGSVALMILLDWRLSIFLIILGVSTGIVNKKFSDSLRRLNGVIQKQLGRMSERLTDILAGFHVIKLYGINDILARKFDRVNDKTSVLYLLGVKKYSLLGVAGYFVGMINFAGVIAIGGLMIYKKMIDLGTLGSLMMYQSNLTSIILTIGATVAMFQTSLAGAGRIFEILDREPEPKNVGSCGESKSDNAIEFRDVAFGYSEGEKKAVDGLNISVGKGSVVALVGPSGGGKSTIIKLILGFYPIKTGTIYIHEKPMGNYTLDQLRDFIAYVPQEPYLFVGTIEENIRHGKPGATREEVVEAAKSAYAHDFIMSLADGYQTEVGERGAKISGGQRQRIALARAFIKNAPIVLLDEATSSLDSESEYQIQKALAALMTGRSVVVVAHRLSTVESADKIYVVEDGKVIEVGGHKELLTLEGTYSKLYHLQFHSGEADMDIA